MSFEEPKHKKNRVNAAGNYIRDASWDDVINNRDEYLKNIHVLNNWRASHAYVINTFQANLRRRTRNMPYIVGQRLKRHPTIVDKLRRHRGMQLSRMHDIAGCRVIFPTEEELMQFRHSFHASRMRHELRGTGNDPYNYIKNPKNDGYRGIHDVYKYNVSSAGGAVWNGLLIEVQYRTNVQHAWATAVETADLAMSGRAKFGESSSDVQNFFKFASEILARAHENKKSCLPEVSDREVVTKFRWIDRNLRMMERLQQLNKAEDHKFEKHVILKFVFSDNPEDSSLHIESFGNLSKALERYAEIESEVEDKMDAVLIPSADAETIREVFKNYFSDATSFVGLIDEGIYRLGEVRP